MNLLDSKQILKEVNKVSDSIERLIHANFPINDPIVSDQVVKLKQHIHALLEHYEEAYDDALMDKAKNNIPSMDEVFKDSPVTEFKNEVVMHLEKNMEVPENVSEGDSESYFEEFANSVVEDLDFGVYQKRYKKDFKTELATAVEMLSRRDGKSTFLVTLDGKTHQGSMRSDRGVVTINILGKMYTYDFSVSGHPIEEEIEEYFVNDEEEAIEGEDTCKQNPSLCDYTPCRCKSDSACLLEDIKNSDVVYYTRVEKYLRDIEENLSGKQEFTSDEKDLIRFYFKHQPYIVDYGEIDSLSDNALKLAWKYEMYKKYTNK